MILGLGPSVEAYLTLAKRLGGRSAYAEELWGINCLGDILRCDRVFHMDDVRVQEGRAAMNPEGNIAAMLRWLRTHPGPIYTSNPHPDYPGLVPFPLEALLNARLDGGHSPYFNSTAAYAIAFAVYLGVKRISLFGIDYTLPNVHSGECGRACCEYWLGVASARGITITVPEQSSLLDACAPERELLYGYDMLDVTLSERADGSLTALFADRSDPPTAQEIERRYDHTKHPNRLMKGEVA
ncbi:MAG: hypothetical protein AB7S41_20135 [Parvibaculaceae bacterium]